MDHLSRLALRANCLSRLNDRVSVIHEITQSDTNQAIPIQKAAEQGSFRGLFFCASRPVRTRTSALAALRLGSCLPARHVFKLFGRKRVDRKPQRL